MRLHALTGAVLALVWSAPALATTADDICAAAADPCVVATPVAVTNLSVIDVGARELRINAGGALDVGFGTMTIRAGRLTVNASGFVRANGSSSATGGTLTIDAGALTVLGSIEANGAPGGTITITSPGDVSIAGTGVSARALTPAEVGGTISISGATVSLSSLVSVFGGFDALGGDATISATGAVAITGTIDATGGDGGSIDVTAGAMPGAGDVIIGTAAILKVDATAAGGFGGTVDVSAHGDAVDSGRVRLDGTLSALGKSGSTDTGGGAGGCITVAADGDVDNESDAAAVNASGGGPDGDGGEVEVTSRRGTVTLNGKVDGGSAGAESSGGSLTVDAGQDASVMGTLSVRGGDGGAGEIDVNSATANVRIGRAAQLVADATSGGAGGAISLDSGLGDVGTRSIVVEGTLSAAGGANGGAGGTLELDGNDAVRVAATATLRAAGAVGGGLGGTIMIDVAGGPALVDGALTAAGGSPSGAGGVIAVDASQRIVLTAAADAHGFGSGGRIGLASTGDVDVRGNLLASSSAANGGSIEIRSEGAAMIAASLIADGITTPGASVDVEACSLTVCGLDSPVCPSGGAGVLSSLGPEGRNRTTGREATVILGTLRADPTSGRNVLLYDGDPAREPFVLGTVVPAALVTASDLVTRCPACGNGSIEPPETCDDDNQLDGDGCSHLCQVEAPIPGDANGDYVLAPDDRGFAIAEIFDGDGDTVGTVSGGTFAGGPGADANDDGFVTAADLVAITTLLAP
ncbi:MAG: hypothetical protein U0802_10155 [Candidatus Binatia bacterium]